MARRVITAREQHELAEPFLRLAAEEPLADWEKELMADAPAEPVVPSGITADILKKHYPENGDFTNESMAEDWSHGGDLDRQQQAVHEHLTKLTTPGHSFYDSGQKGHADKWKAIHEDAFGEPWTGEVEHSDKAKSVAENAADAFAGAGFKVKTQDEFFKDHAPPGSGPKAKDSPKPYQGYLNEFLDKANSPSWFGNDPNDEWTAETEAIKTPAFGEWFTKKYPNGTDNGEPLYPDVVVGEYLEEKKFGPKNTSSDDDYDQIQELLKPVTTPPPANTPDLSGMEENLQNFFLTDADEGSQYGELANNEHFKDWFDENYPDFGHGDAFPQDIVFEYETPWNEHDYDSQPVWMKQMSYGSDADGELHDWQKEVGPEQIHDWDEDYDDGGLQAIHSFHEYLDNKGIDHPDDLDVAMHVEADIDTTEEYYEYWKDQLPYGAEEYFAEYPTQGGYDYSEWQDYYNGETLHHKSNWPEGPHTVNYEQLYSDQSQNASPPESLTSGYDSFVPGFKAYMMTQYPDLEQYEVNNFDRDDWSNLEQGWNNLSSSDQYKLINLEGNNLHPDQPDEKFAPTEAPQASTPTPVPSGPVVPFATPFPTNQHGMPVSLAGYKALADTIWGSSVGQVLKDQWIETQMAGGGFSGTTHKYLKDNYPQQWQNWQTQQGGAQPAAAPQDTPQVTPQMVIDHLVDQPGSGWKWNPENHNSSSIALLDLSGKTPEELKAQLEEWAADTHSYNSTVSATATKTLDALFGSGAQPQATPKTAVDYKPKTEAEWNKFFQILGEKSGITISEAVKNYWKNQTDKEWALNLDHPGDWLKTWMAHHDSQPQETASATFHKQLVTSPEFKAWFKKDNSFDLDKDDKDGSLRKMLLDPTNDWTMGKLIQFKNAQGKTKPGQGNKEFSPDAFAADYKKKFPGSTYTSSNFGSPMAAQNILQTIIDEDVSDGVGYYDGDDYDDEEDAENYAAFPNYEIYQDAVDEWEYQKEQAQELYDKYFGDGGGLDDQGAPGHDSGQDEAANKFGQLLNDNAFYNWVTGKTGEVNHMAQAFYPKYPQYALDAWEAKKSQGAAPAPSYTPHDIAQAATDAGWTHTAESFKTKTLEQVKAKLEDIASGTGYITSTKDIAQNLLDKFFGSGAAPVSADPEALKSSLAKAWNENYSNGGKHVPAGPSYSKWVEKLSPEALQHFIDNPVAGHTDFDKYLNGNLGISTYTPPVFPSATAPAAFDALQAATEYGKILGIGPDIEGGGQKYKDLSYQEFKDKLASNIEKAKNGFFYPEALPKFQALYNKYFGQSQGYTPQGPVDLGSSAPLKIPVDPFGTPDSLMSGDDLNPDFEKWLWASMAPGMSPENFLTAIQGWTPEHWTMAGNAFLGKNQPAAAAVSADPQALKDQLTVLWNIQQENGEHHHFPQGGSYKQWTNKLSPEALQHFLDNPDAGHADFDKFLDSPSWNPYKPPVFPSASPVAGSYAPGYTGPPAEWMQKHYNTMGPWTPEKAQKWWSGSGKNSMAGNVWKNDKHGDKADFPLPPVPAAQGAANFDPMAFAQDAAAAFGGNPDLAHDGGKLFKDMTYDEAKTSIAQGAGGDWGGDKAKWKAVYDKYFGSAAPAGPAPLVSADPLANNSLVEKELHAAAAIGYGFSAKLYNTLNKNPGALQTWMKLSPAEKAAITDQYETQGPWADEHQNDVYQPEGVAAGGHDYDKINQLAQKMSHSGGGNYITDTADWMTWAHGLSPKNLAYFATALGAAAGKNSFEKFLEFGGKDGEYDDDPYYALKKWYEDNHGTTNGFYNLAKNPQEFGKFYDQWRQETSGGDLDTFTEEPETPAVGTGVPKGHYTPSDMLAADGTYTQLALDYMKQSGWPVPSSEKDYHNNWDEKSWNAVLSKPGPESPDWKPGNEVYDGSGKYLSWQEFKEVEGGEQTEPEVAPATKVPAWVTTSDAGKKYFPNGPQEYPGFAEFFKALKANNSKMSVSTALNQWHKKPQSHKDNWVEQAGQTPAPAPTFANPFAELMKKPNFYDQFQAIMGHDPDKIEKNKQLIAEKGVDWVKSEIKKRLKVEQDPEKFVKLVDLWQKNFGGPTGSGAITPLLKKLKPGQPLDQATMVKLWQLHDTGGLPDWIKNAPADTSNDLWPTYEEQDDPLGNGSTSAAASGTTNPEIPDNLGLAAKWATDGGLSIGWFNGNEQTQQEKKDMLLKHINETDYFDEEQKAKLQQVHDKFFGDDAVAAAPQSSPEYDKNAFALDVATALSPWDNYATADDWDYGLAKSAQEALQFKIGDLTNPSTAAALQKIYDKWFGSGAAPDASEIPDALGKAVKWATPKLSSDFFSSTGSYLHNTDEIKKKALQTHINGSTFDDATKAKLQQVYDKFFGENAAPQPGGMTFDEMKDKIKAADPTYWANHPEKFKNWGQEDWLDELKTMVANSIDSPSAFKPGEVNTYKEIIKQIEGGGPGTASGGTYPSGMSGGTAPYDKAEVLKWLKIADPDHWNHAYSTPESMKSSLKSMLKSGEDYIAANGEGSYTNKEMQIYKDLIAKYCTTPAPTPKPSAKGFDEDYIVQKLQEADSDFWHDDRIEELKDKNWDIEGWKKYVQGWQDNGQGGNYSDAEMKCYEDILDYLDNPSSSAGSPADFGGAAPPPGQQYPPGMSSWGGGGGSAPAPSMSDIVRGQLSTMVDKLRAPESEGIYNEDDISVARSPEFQKWFRDAPAPYRQTTSQFPSMALEDYAKGGEYGWVPESTGDIARVYDPYSYPAKGSGKGGWITTPSGERLRLPGYGDRHWPGTTFNPESTDRARPPTNFPNRPPDVPGQLEIPLPDGSSWVPDKKFPELRRGIGVEFDRYKPGNADHKLLTKPGIIGERHRDAARLLKEIKELMVGPQPSRNDSPEDEFKKQFDAGTNIFDPPWTLFDAETHGTDFVDAPPKPSRHDPDSWLEWLAFAQKNNVPPEQMWDLAKSVGSSDPDKYGTPPISYLIAQSHRDPAPMAKEVSRLIGEEFTATDLSAVSKKLKRIRDNGDRGSDYDQKTRNRAEDLYDKWFGQRFVDDLLAHKILEYVETAAYKPSDYKDHPNVGGMGNHWTTKSSTDFGSGRSADESGFPLEVIIDWPGAGEDPDRKDAAWGHSGEKEIALNPGTPVVVKRIRFKHPKHGDPENGYSNRWITYDFTPHKRHATIAPRRQGRAIVSHRERFAADDDPGADFDVWPDPYENRPINFGQPTSLKTPRYDEHTRPVHDNGEYYFSPHEINPASNSSSRPDIRWVGHEPEQDVLPDIDFPDEAAPGIPIDRYAQPLYRGLSLDLTHPDAAEIHRMVYGHHPDDHHMFDLDQEPQPRYDHPELSRAILDHLEHSRQPTHGLGRHWSVSPSEAHGFAISQAQSLLNDPDSIQLPVRLRADWKGAGENPYRHETGEIGRQFADEMEMNMLPGADMNIGGVQIRHPDLHRWVTLDHQPEHRHAQHATVRPRSAKRILTHREMMEG